MPKNTQGGSKHKSGCNSESSTVRKNKRFFDDLLSDVRTGEGLGDILFGRVMSRKGEGRMEVIYYDSNRNGHTCNVPITGALRGRGKRDAFIDTGTIVVLTDIGLDSGTTHKITHVLSKAQIAILRKTNPDLLDDRLFVVQESAAGAAGAGGEDVFEAHTAEEDEEDSGEDFDIDAV
jgi:hypothetical protein